MHDFVPNDSTTRGAIRQVQMIAIASGEHLKKSQAFNIVKKIQSYFNHATISID